MRRPRLSPDSDRIMHSGVLIDRGLACRLERAEGLAGARFVEARARLAPDSGAQWIEIAGAYAMYDGSRSPSTQTFALGIFQMPTAADMDALEAFFTDRGAPVFHEAAKEEALRSELQKKAKKS